MFINKTVFKTAQSGKCLHGKGQHKNMSFNTGLRTKFILGDSVETSGILKVPHKPSQLVSRASKNLRGAIPQYFCFQPRVEEASLKELGVSFFLWI